MYARSLVWSLRDVQTCVDLLHGESILCGNTMVVERTNNARRTIHELIELLRSGRIHRSSQQGNREDASMRRFLRAMYDGRTGRVTELTERVDGGKKTIDALRSNGQVEQRHGELFVPLRGGGTARNWPPVLQLIIGGSRRQVQDCRELVEKVRADGAEPGMIEYNTLQSLVERLDALQRVLRSHLGQLQVVNYTVTVDKKIEEFLADTVPSAFALETQSEEIS